MFKGCSALKTVEYGGSPVQIGVGAFDGCESLTGFSIPSTVTSIGIAAFRDCRSLPRITIPGGVTYISANTFENCEAIKSIGIPDDVTVIGDYAFHGCTSLESVYVPDSVARIGHYAFSGCTSLETAYLPGTVTTLGSYVFSDCTSLHDLTLSEGLTNVTEGMFENCTGLQNVYVPEGVTSIGNSAFSGCSGLRYIALPSTLKYVNLNTFKACTALEWIAIPETIKSSLGTNAFADCGTIRVIFPNNVYSYWRTNDDPSVNTFAGSAPVIYCNSGSKISEYAQKDGFRVVYLDGPDSLYLDTGANEYGPNVERRAGFYAPGMVRTAIGWSWQFENEGEYPEVFDGEECYVDLTAPWDDGEYEIVAKAWDESGLEYESRQTVLVVGVDKLGPAGIAAPSSIAPGADFTFSFEAVEHAEWYSAWVWPIGEGEPYVLDEQIDGPGTYTVPSSYFQDGRMYRLDVKAYGTDYTASDDAQHPFAVQSAPGSVDYSFTLEKSAVLVEETANFIVDAPGATALRWRDSTDWGGDGSPDHWNDWWMTDSCVIDRQFGEPGTYALQIMLSYDEGFDWENDDWDAHSWTVPSEPLTVSVTALGRLPEVDMSVPASVTQGSVLPVTFSGLDHVAGYDAVIHDSETWEDMYRIGCRPGTVSLLTSTLTPGRTYTAEICAFGEAGWVSSYTMRDFTVAEPSADTVTITLEDGPYYIGKDFNFSILAPGATSIQGNRLRTESEITHDREGIIEGPGTT
ncbi:MAG: leucine-rich repeat domain-containing protein, partial [Clostridiales bacterium]|nr:leucine-rich repeat domain-containing protein [Clostridiales bacterium]